MDSRAVERVLCCMDKTLCGLNVCRKGLWWHGNSMGSRTVNRVFGGMDKTLHRIKVCRKGLWWHGQDTGNNCSVACYDTQSEWSDMFYYPIPGMGREGRDKSNRTAHHTTYMI